MSTRGVVVASVPDRRQGAGPASSILALSGFGVGAAGGVALTVTVIEEALCFDGGNFTVLFDMISPQGPGIVFEVTRFVDESDPPGVCLQVIGHLLAQLADESILLADGIWSKESGEDGSHVTNKDSIGFLGAFGVVVNSRDGGSVGISILEDVLVGINVLKVARQAARVVVHDIAAVRRTSTAATMGDIAVGAHESARQEEEEGKKEGGEGGVRGGGVSAEGGRD